MKGNKATVYDVAKRAGVSKTTVSRYINNHPVKDQTAKAIEKAIKDLDFVPNQVARILSMSKTNLIGVIIPDITNLFFPVLVKCIDDELAKEGYKAILFNTENRLESERTAYQFLLSNRVDGIISISGKFDELQIKKPQMPIICLDGYYKEATCLINSDHFAGGYLAATTLIEKGCQRLLHLSGSRTSYSSNLRARGFAAACEKKGLADWHILDENAAAIKEEDLLYAFIMDHKIDGVFAWHDMLAIKSMNALKERGLQIPDQVQCIGFDNLDLSQLVTPQLSTIAQPIDAIGQLAVKELLRAIDEQENYVSEEKILAVKYIDRGSTK